MIKRATRFFLHSVVKKFSPESDDLIRSLWYQGIPRPEIEKQAVTSAGHISDVVAEEKRLVGEDNVDALRRLAIEVGKAKHTTVDLMRGIRFLNACDGRGMDDEKVIECIPRLDEACKRSGISIQDLPVDVESRVAKAKELDARIEKGKMAVAEADKLKVMGANLPLLKAITDVAKRVGAANKMTDRQAMEKFTTDILAKYEPLAGLEQAFVTAQKEFARVEAQMEKLKIEYAQHAQAIDALTAILASGGKASDVLSTKHMLEKGGSSLPALSSKVSLYGSMDSAYRELEKQVKDLEAKRLALEADVSLLGTRKEGLEKFLESADETIKKQVESMINAGQNASTTISNAVAKADKDIADTRVAVLGDITAIGEKAKAVTKEYALTQGVRVFEPLIRVVNGEKGDSKEVRNAVLFAMSIMLSRLSPHSKHRASLEALIEDLRDDITFGLFS